MNRTPQIIDTVRAYFQASKRQRKACRPTFLKMLRSLEVQDAEDLLPE